MRDGGGGFQWKVTPQAGERLDPSEMAAVNSQERTSRDTTVKSDWNNSFRFEFTHAIT